MLQIGPGPDVHVQTADREATPGSTVQAVGDVCEPDAMFRLLAARIGLLAVTVAEPRIDPQRDLSARRPAAELIDHVGRAAVDVDIVLYAQVERWRVKNVSGIDERRGIAAGGIAGGQSAVNFAGADRLDQGAFATNEIENGEVGAGLLGIAHDVEGGQVGDPPPDHGGVVDESRRAKLPGQRGHG